jgi:membrane associated rhomboid family serine protease
MIPLYDESAPSLKPPYVTVALIFTNIFVFILTYYNSNFDAIVLRFGDVPSRFFSGDPWAFVTIFTSMFLHGSILHLVFNMWFLWLFGDNVEYNLGKIRFILFYFIGGAIACLANTFLSMAFYQNMPTIGASGAISAVLGGYLLLFPKNRIKAFFLLFITPVFFNVPAFIYIGLWFVLELVSVFTDGGISMIAYWAHIGGLVGGIFLALALGRRVNRTDYISFGINTLSLDENEEKQWRKWN